MATATAVKPKLKDAEVLGKQPLVVIGIPAFNEERTIGRVVLQARKYADVVVVCDDGSADMTAEIAKGLGAVVVRHERNSGYGAAIQSLFEEARQQGADVLVTLDADGQHVAEGVPLLVQPILEGVADLVTASRFSGGVPENRGSGLPWYRRWGIKAITRLTASASRCQLSDAQNGFRAYGRVALERLALSENGMGLSVEVLVRAEEEELRLVEVPLDCVYAGVERPSSRNPVRHGLSVVSSLARLVVEGKPLLFLGVPGVLSLAVGMFFGVWMLHIYSLEHRIVTNIALAAIAFTIVGLFSVFTAITLYAISRMTQRISNRH